MKKFVVVYRVPLEVMAEWRKNTSQEEMMKQGKELGGQMEAWMKKNEKSFVDKGNPLGKNKRLMKDGVQDVSNDLNYYQVVEANTVDEVITMCKDNPHIAVIPEAFLDIMEVPQMGM